MSGGTTTAYLQTYTAQQTFLSLLRGHSTYFWYQSIVSLVLLMGYSSYHVYWEGYPFHGYQIILKDLLKVKDDKVRIIFLHFKT